MTSEQDQTIDMRTPARWARTLGLTVIVTAGTAPVIAAKQATSVIPIVFAIAGNPVATGLVASLARPGGNVTGAVTMNAELGAKRLGLL